MPLPMFMCLPIFTGAGTLICCYLSVLMQRFAATCHYAHFHAFTGLPFYHYLRFHALPSYGYYLYCHYMFYQLYIWLPSQLAFYILTYCYLITYSLWLSPVLSLMTTGNCTIASSPTLTFTTFTFG